jgi:hypothetical protein
MVYSQAPIKMDMYMELPTGGIHTKHGNSKDHILKLPTNIWGKSKPVVCGVEQLPCHDATGHQLQAVIY